MYRLTAGDPWVGHYNYGQISISVFLETMLEKLRITQNHQANDTLRKNEL